ncbi:MAG TPA: hypothetical protein VFN82_00840 [Solirubrobacterales bacterium]|nr:hypothetical protein [Solirubrobacterales bacterium]
MYKKLMQLAGIAALGACSLLTVSALAEAAPTKVPPGKETVLTFVEPEKGGTFKFVDAAPKAKLKHGFPLMITPGDEVIFTNPMEVEGKRVGKLRVVCTATSRAKKFGAAGFVCNGIAKFSNGTLVFSALLSEGKTTEGAIIGGSGIYAGADGVFVSKEGKKSSTTTVRLFE